MTTYKLVDAIGRLKEDQDRLGAIPRSRDALCRRLRPEGNGLAPGRYPSGGKVHGNPGPQWVESLQFANLKMILTIGAAYLQTPGYEHLASTWLGPIERIVQLAEESE